MVFVRRAGRVVRPRRLRRRRVMRPRVRRNPALHAPKKFVETLNLTDIQTLGGGVGSGYNLKLSLSQLTNPGPLASVFEQYCITGIKYVYIPRYNVAYLDADEGVQMPQVMFCENKIDTTVPASEIGILQEDNVKIVSASKRWSLYVNKPKPWITQSSEGNVGTQVLAQSGARFISWLPMTESGQAIDHLALRLWVQGNNSASNFTVGTIYAKVYYALKEQH